MNLAASVQERAIARVLTDGRAQPALLGLSSCFQPLETTATGQSTAVLCWTLTARSSALKRLRMSSNSSCSNSLSRVCVLKESEPLR